MTSSAAVSSWNPDEGWGVLECADTPGGCWFFFDALRGVHPQSLAVGDRLDLEFEPAEQDGFHFRAVSLSPVGVDVKATEPETRDSPAYRSRLGLDLDPGSGTD